MKHDHGDVFGLGKFLNCGRVIELFQHGRQRVDRRTEVSTVARPLQAEHHSDAGEHVGPLAPEARNIADLLGMGHLRREDQADNQQQYNEWPG